MIAHHYGSELPTPDQARQNAAGWPTASAQTYAKAQALGIEPDALVGFPVAPDTDDYLAAMDLV
jgi:hypothetical protein